MNSFLENSIEAMFPPTDSGNLMETLSNTTTCRENGRIHYLFDLFGLIERSHRERFIYFSYDELSGDTHHLNIGDFVNYEFTCNIQSGKYFVCDVIKIDPPSFPKGVRLTGTIISELNSEGAGRIVYRKEGQCHILKFKEENVEGYVPLQYGHTVTFYIKIGQRGIMSADRVRYHETCHNLSNENLGFISELIDGFGFIRNVDRTKETFFEYKIFEGNVSSLHVGLEVEYTSDPIVTLSSFGRATTVRMLPDGTISPTVAQSRGAMIYPLSRIFESNLYGVLANYIIALNPDQPEYRSILEAGGEYNIGILPNDTNQREMNLGDLILYQKDENGRVFSILPPKRNGIATVETYNGRNGILRILDNSNVTINFAMPLNNREDLLPGNIVEFDILIAPDGKRLAINVRKRNVSVEGINGVAYQHALPPEYDTNGFCYNNRQ